MPTLVSPGVSVSVIDESMYASAGQGTVPLVVVATAQDKTDPSTGNTAVGTTSANVGKPFLVTSQRELVTTFGEPSFKSLQGTMLHGDERNEYGLLSTYSYLGISNRAYVVRADVDLDELEGSSNAPKITSGQWNILVRHNKHRLGSVYSKYIIKFMGQDDTSNTS